MHLNLGSASNYVHVHVGSALRFVHESRSIKALYKKKTNKALKGGRNIRINESNNRIAM